VRSSVRGTRCIARMTVGAGWGCLPVPATQVGVPAYPSAGDGRGGATGCPAHPGQRQTTRRRAIAGAATRSPGLWWRAGDGRGGGAAAPVPATVGRCPNPVAMGGAELKPPRPPRPMAASERTSRDDRSQQPAQLRRQRPRMCRVLLPYRRREGNVRFRTFPSVSLS